MAKYLLKRLLQSLVVLVVVSAVIFFTVRLSPSDPIASITKGKTVTAQVREDLLRRFNLDKSPIQQYYLWIGGMLKGDFGESYQYRQPVSLLVSQRVKTTVQLAALSTVLAILIAVPLGIVLAVKANSFTDKALSIISLVFVASPTFLIGVIFMLVFALRLKWFPSMGTGSFRHLVLPSCAMAINMVALTSRITRQSMIEELSSDYITAAYAKGVGPLRIIFIHALRNAVIPVITITSLQIGGMLVGAVLVETVFAMGGLGDLLISSIKSSDYPVVQGVTMMMIVVYCALSVVVDTLYAIIDPRIRLQ
ncbi:MAG: ABC transporter permease [Eubacteriaceae bacterium]|nr:ABC transporter permease [Eubacteriaceae bacterium]